MEFISSYTDTFLHMITSYVIPFAAAAIIVLVFTFLIAGVFVYAIFKASNKAFVITWIVFALLMLPLGISAYVAIHDSFEEVHMRNQAEKDNPQIGGQVRIERFIVVNRNPPKHFYVTLKNVSTNAVYEHQYVSKHCNNHTQIKDGEQVNIAVYDVWRKNTPEQKTLVFQNLYKVFCE